MKDRVEELRSIVESYTAKIGSISSSEFSDKPLSNKWSKKEVLGHLIDSAQNNLRRFICGQYEVTPSRIVYDQNLWVIANAYQNAAKEDVIALWRLMNLRICDVLKNMPSENYQKLSDNGSLNTLEWLATDYVRHLKHHLNQIISGSFDVIYKS
jgi:hypothetical protein